MKSSFTIAVALAFFAGLLGVLPEAGAQNEFNCSVEPAEGGILLQWTEVEGAASYQYKLDVEGRGSDYRRVNGTSVLIALPDGTTGSVGLAPVMADGSGPARVDCGSAAPLDGTGVQMLTCSVESASGGINVSWTEIPGAVTYAYRLSVQGKSPRYRRMTGTSTFIGLSDGVTGTVSMTPVFADGSTMARVACGSAAPLDGTGTTTFTCSVSSDPGGLLLTWSSVPSAVSYGYRVSVEGVGSRYGRLTGTSGVIALDAGLVGSVGINPIAADGSTVARTDCGSATAGGGGGGDPFAVTTCASTDNGTNIDYSWNVTGDPDDFSNYRIVYNVQRPGEDFAEVAREFNIDARTYTIGLQAGDVITSTIQVEFNDGTRSTEIPCGTVTIPDAPPAPLAITACTSTDNGTNIDYSWTAAGEADNFRSYRIDYSVDRPLAGFSEVGREFDIDARTYTIGLRAGDIVTSTIRIEYTGNTLDVVIPCGTVTIGGLPGGPECFIASPTLNFSLITDAVTYRITLTTGGDSQVIDVDDNTPFDVTGEPGDVIDVSVQAIFADGSTTLNTSCGTVTIPDSPSTPFVVTTCTSTSTGTNIDYGWTVDGDPDRFGNYRIVYNVDRPGTGFTEVARDFNIDARSYTIGLQAGDIVTSTIQIEYNDGTRSAEIPCGSVTIGGLPAGPECFLAGRTLSFSTVTDAVTYRITLATGGDQQIVDVADNTPFDITGLPGEVVDVSVQAIFADGTTTLNTNCGTVTIDGA